MEPNTWSSVLVEELMETDVIDGRNMAILKEQCKPGILNDSALLINLRHDKLVRASLRSSESPTHNAEVMAEAKRMLWLEDKNQKKVEAENKIVDHEIKKFQDHIVNLRKMNRRLERLTCTPSLHSKKKLERGVAIKLQMHPSEHVVVPKKNHECTRIAGTYLQQDIPPHPSCDTYYCTKQSELINPSFKLQSSCVAGKTPIQKGRENFIVCGSKLEDCEVLQFHSDPCIRGPGGYQYSIFEQLHHKYAESERLKVLNGKEDCKRNPTPTDITSTSNQGELNGEPPVALIPNIPMKQKESTNFKENEVTLQDRNLFGHSSSAEANPIMIGKWNASASHNNVVKPLDKKSVAIKSLKSHLPPSANGKKNEKVKLDSMSAAYVKWMKDVCGESDATVKSAINKEKKASRDTEYTKTRDITFVNREEKIAQVLETLHKSKEIKSTFLRDGNHHKGHQFSKSVSDLNDDKLSFNLHRKGRRVVSGSYEHRLLAQKDIIVQQKAKLEEQQKQIEEFKLSQLQMEAEKSRQQAQKTLNYMIQSCDDSTKVHAKHIQSSFSIVDLTPGNAFVERMEQRAMEQRQKKLLSQERRKQFEEQWKLKIKEEEEKKRRDEETLARKRNEEKQEMRRLERLAREEARKERERMIVLEKKAYAHSCRRKVKNAFRGFKKLIILRRQQSAIAERFYSDHLMLRTLEAWKKHVDQSISAKMSVAHEFYKLTLMRRFFTDLIKEHQMGAIRMQVAVDFYEYRLQDKVFHCWLQLTQDQHVIYAEKILKAEELYGKILMKQCFKQWLKLPEITQQEREKERRKTVLRRKVQQLIPDYRPTISSD